MSDYENTHRITAEKVFGARTARTVGKTTVTCGTRSAGAECAVYESISRCSGVLNNKNIWRMSARHKQAATNKWRMFRMTVGAAEWPSGNTTEISTAQF